MKFITFVLIVFVIGAMLSPVPIRATVVEGSGGEVDVTCVATELRPCLPALTLGGNPTDECCTKLNEQKPCLCDYIKNPAYSKYVSSPNARKVLAACNVPYPSCGNS
ncbi:putative non-specific lipid-transfer protein AKCS9 [Cardamine amara subsp. amara]|uniref:Non-specific lipid-transfer protein AKCS9 n=1 Tax=Cardamine amara subsp. amara TaxID=228776 RepID=A0ABD1AJS2_CARAN